MLLFVYRSIVTVLLVLVMMFIELSAARGIVAALGYYDLIGLSTFAVNLLSTLAIAASTDYAIFLRRPLPRGTSKRRGSRNRLLHHVSRHRPRHLRIRPDDCGRHVLPALHTAALLPIAWHSVGDRDARRRHRGADHGARPADHLQPLRHIRSETEDADARLASHGHRRGALAGTDPCRVGGSHLYRSAGGAVVQTRLQRPPLSAARYPGQCGIRGGRPALPAGPDESRRCCWSRPITMCATRPTCW